MNTNQFGKLFALNVDGSIYAQPLYVPNVAVAGKGTHNVVYVATMNDKLYAFDADSNTGANASPLWMRDFTNPGAGVTAVPIVDVVGSNSLSIVGNVGIESTPVIDLAKNTMYLVARTKESGTYFQRLHAVDIRSGSDLSGSPMVIQGTSDGQTFDPKIHNQRSSLAIANGMVLIAWGSHEDDFNYHGWIMAYSEATLAQVYIFCVTPSGAAAGVWESGWAPAVDANQNVYYSTGNGTWDGISNFGESFLKFSTSSGVSMVDWFTPDNYSTLNGNDVDLGASGPLLIPGTSLMVGGGKEGIFYLLKTASLGHETTGNTGAVQLLNTAGGQLKGGPVYWNRSGGNGPWMYVWPTNDSLKAFHFNGSTFDTTPVSQSTFRAPGGSSPGVLALSANGSTAGSGIVWSSIPLFQDADHGVVSGILRAFDANNLSTEIWNSLMNASRDDIVTWPKYCPPLVVNGKVYMGSFSNALFVFGLLPPDFTVGAAPAKAAVSPGNTTYYTATIGANDFYNNPVNLSVSGLPAGTSGTFNPSTVTGAGTSTLTITTSSNTPLGTFPLTITGTGGSLHHSAPVSLEVIAFASNGTVSIDFAGSHVPMGPAEVAGVVPKSFWNAATGASSTSPLALVDETGTGVLATVTWKSDTIWSLPVPDQPGNQHMINGYIDVQNATSTATVTVASLAPASYNLYVYTDGDNNSATRTGIFQISGSGITTKTISATDAAGKNFNGTFTQANNSNGNYVVFPFTGTGFTLTANAGAASDGTHRAPINGIQIVPTSSNPDFTFSATPSSASVTAGGGTSYTVTLAGVGGFNSAVNLSVSGLPAGGSGTFNPATVTGSGNSTLNITTGTNTPSGTYPLTITGTSGSLQHSASVNLVVSSTSGGGNGGGNGTVSIDFVGEGVPMTAAEVAGVVPKAFWNKAAGASSASPLALVDETGTSTTARVTWNSDIGWNLPLADQPGDQRMMNGYIDVLSATSTTTVTVAGLAPASYNLYVYTVGDNNTATRTGIFQISGSGITTKTISATDASGTSFYGAFTQANNSNGNYVVFPFTGTGFTLTASAGAASDGTHRAPINGIQIVPQ